MFHDKLVAAALSCGLALLAVACGDAETDREIAVKVDREIASSPVLGDTQIEVAANDGVVTLSGIVASQEQADRAERLAWSVEGVEAVETRLEVSAPEPGALPPVGAPPAPREGEGR